MSLPVYQHKQIPKTAPITSFGEVIDPVLSLRNCEIGKCFVVDNDKQRYRIAAFARRLDFKVKTKRNEAGKYDIWRTK